MQQRPTSINTGGWVDRPTDAAKHSYTDSSCAQLREYYAPSTLQSQLRAFALIAFSDFCLRFVLEGSCYSPVCSPILECFGERQCHHQRDLRQHQFILEASLILRLSFKGGSFTWIMPQGRSFWRAANRESSTSSLTFSFCLTLHRSHALGWWPDSQKQHDNWPFTSTQIRVTPRCNSACAMMSAWILPAAAQVLSSGTSFIVANFALSKPFTSVKTFSQTHWLHTMRDEPLRNPSVSQDQPFPWSLWSFMHEVRPQVVNLYLPWAW